MKFGNLMEVINNMKIGVYNFTDNGKCINCGECCTSLLPVTNDEIKEIQKYIKRKHIKPCKSKVEGTSFDLTCPFRNDAEKICNIYEVRPFICRDFKCDKPQNEIECAKSNLSYDKRFHIVNLREIFR